jgi:hypothetical protein
MVLEQEWVTPAQQENTKKEEVPTAPLDILNEIESDFVLLPAAEVHCTYQDPALSTKHLHQWGETDKYANKAGTRVVTELAKGRKRRKPERTDDAPTLLSPTDARAWGKQYDVPTTAITFRTLDAYPHGITASLASGVRHGLSGTGS